MYDAPPPSYDRDDDIPPMHEYGDPPPPLHDDQHDAPPPSYGLEEEPLPTYGDDDSPPSYSNQNSLPSYDASDPPDSDSDGFEFHWSPAADIWEETDQTHGKKEEDRIFDADWDPLVHRTYKSDARTYDPLQNKTTDQLPEYDPNWKIPKEEFAELDKLMQGLKDQRAHHERQATQKLIATLGSAFTEMMLDIRKHCQTFVMVTENLAIQKYARRSLSKKKAELKAEKELQFVKQMCAFAAWDTFEEALFENQSTDYNDIIGWTHRMYNERFQWKVSEARAKAAKGTNKLAIAGKVAVASVGSAVGVAASLITLGGTSPLIIGIGMAVANSMFANWAESKIDTYAMKKSGGGAKATANKVASLGISVGLTFAKMAPVVSFLAEGVQYLHSVTDTVLSEEMDKTYSVSLSPLTKKRVRVLVLAHNLENLMDDVEDEIQKQLQVEKTSKGRGLFSASSVSSKSSDEKETEAVRKLELVEKRKVQAEWDKWIPEDISALGLNADPQKGLQRVVEKYLAIRTDKEKWAEWKQKQTELKGEAKGEVRQLLDEEEDTLVELLK
uniref:Uncharacterized protein n=1 Tax=Chromera velia CCMP2878 TaxID=1169474 RepID=A0A0G4HE57_9ALVE|eukprot:Cvel_6521.t1-p1 / transcript=Cvel_6521.t1 / gene=Cvel_6521 / organism=Chromera_velia_CCMP2878 / gene_product=hypothetical protein / transcript_product=hypothetical protein / location=Cvel_scaffold320:87890-89557(+) / protein_length=556 / sequence_SO=supercontig / SO=protein_coding / is_pseudo=false